MSGVSLETCWAIKVHWNNKFYYTVASCWLFLYDLSYDARIHKHQVFKRVFGIKLYYQGDCCTTFHKKIPQIVYCIIITAILLRHMFNPLKPELIPICYLLALLAHHFFHVSRIRVKSLTIRLLMSYIYIYGARILDVSRSHTTTQHSR